MADVQKASGEENLRGNPTVKSNTPNSSPSGAGKPVGGTENLRADFKVHAGEDKDTSPASGPDHRPAGVSHYDGSRV